VLARSSRGVALTLVGIALVLAGQSNSFALRIYSFSGFALEHVQWTATIMGCAIILCASVMLACPPRVFRQPTTQ
jgi:hypothetical protein